MGVVIEDDGMTEEEFKDKMLGLNTEYQKLSDETKVIEKTLEANLKELF